MNAGRVRDQLTQDMIILGLARTILTRHDHGIDADCEPGCALTPAERQVHRHTHPEDFTTTVELHRIDAAAWPTEALIPKDSQ